jgi:crotonobetainyl-CoA:carnitine CoA-transferase CaiB-like acyl-CoA transferase
MAGPLAGAVRVLDLSERSPAAAIAGMVLADLGAEVIRVEPEGGDPLRVLAGAQVWMRGQQSVTVTAADMRDAAGMRCAIPRTSLSTPHNHGRRSRPD